MKAFSQSLLQHLQLISTIAHPRSFRCNAQEFLIRKLADVNRVEDFAQAGDQMSLDYLAADIIDECFRRNLDFVSLDRRVCGGDFTL